jgi:ABC-type hemin transport system ATPase subunit
MDLVRATCDELVVMDAGRLLAQGEPSAVLSAPAVVEAYLGSSTAGPAVTVAAHRVAEEERTDA